MSGFEVVGVLLALFPIVVDTVRGYKHAKSGEPLEYLIKDVIAEQILFRSWIGHLLMPTVPPQAVKALLGPKSQKLWEDPGLRAAVERSFGAATTSYLLMTILDIHHELDEIKVALSYVSKADMVSVAVCAAV
jgi:hypothetical protein